MSETICIGVVQVDDVLAVETGLRRDAVRRIP